MQSRILCVDDNKDNNLMLAAMLELSGFLVTSATKVAEAKSLIPEKGFDLFILDQHFEDGTGIELCLDIRMISQKVPIIFYTGNNDKSHRVAALAAGANVYFVKPDDLEKIEPTVVNLLSGRTSRAGAQPF